MINEIKRIREAKYNLYNGELISLQAKKKTLILELEKLQYSSRRVKKNQSMIIKLKSQLAAAKLFDTRIEKIKDINEQLYSLQVSKIKAFLNKSKIAEQNDRIANVDSEIEYNEKLRSQYSYTDYIRSNATESDLSFKACFNIISGIKKTVILDEDDLANFNSTVSNPEKYEGLENFILVHKTNYPPSNSRINSPREVAEYDCDIKSDKIGMFKVADGRNTVHFSVNGEVGNNTGGNWDIRKYAILVPFEQVPKEQIKSYAPMDTYIDGGLKLPNGSYILCPEDEIEAIKEQNPGVNIIGFKGHNVTGYADLLVYYLGYANQQSDSYSWQNEYATKKYVEMGVSKGIFRKSDTSAHLYKYEKDQEKIIININKVKGLIQKIFTDNIQIDNNDIQHIIKNCHFDLRLKSSFKEEALKDLLKELLPFLDSYGIVIPEHIMNRYIELINLKPLTKEEKEEYAKEFYSYYDSTKDMEYVVDIDRYRSYLLLSTILNQVYIIQSEKGKVNNGHTK